MLELRAYGWLILLSFFCASACAQPTPGALTVNQTTVNGGITGDCLKVKAGQILDQGACGGGGAVSLTGGTGISVSPNPITGTGVITNTAPGASPAGSAVTDAQCWASASTFGVCVNPIIGGLNITGLPISTGVSGLGTGIATALGINVGSAGAPVLFNGAGGTPSSLTLTNALGLLAAGLPNAGVFTGDATTTFPALTIGNNAITAIKMVNAGVFTGDATSTFPAITIGAGAITAAKMVNSGVFTGDVTTTFPAITVARVNGITYSATAAAHSVEVITTANTTATAKVIPDCTDSAGNHINYTQSTDAFSCGTSSSGSGTVTSVGFTGGLISVGTPTTTPAFTVAGTSGGIPYFSGAATWASSGAGVQNAMMAWGGAGNAPTSPLALLVTNQNSATELWTLYNSTPTTGVTEFKIRVGAATTNPPFHLYANNGTTEIARVQTNGVLRGSNQIISHNSDLSGTENIAMNSVSGSGGEGFRASSVGGVRFSSDTTWFGSADGMVDRDAAGIVGVTNGTQGTTAANYRAIAASAHYVKGTTFTASGCSNGTLVGGATAGKFTVGANSCTVVVTMGNSATAPNGWFCSPQDQTTAELTAGVYQSASTTTTATFTVPVTAGATDVIGFACIGY